MSRHLDAEGYAVLAAGNAEDALQQIREERPDLILLSWQLPGTSGIEFCRMLRLRRDTSRTPIIMLATRNEEEARVRGLTTGADDFLVKPISLLELTARITALLRRVNPHILSDVLVSHGIELNRATHRVRLAGQEIRIGPTEFRLLELLMSNPGRVYSRERLLDEVWGSDVYVDERTVDVHVGRLRKVIRGDGDTDPIRTVRGTGYAFEERERG
jgi:two-component system phosphate regulon response regulator PhoB